MTDAVHATTVTTELGPLALLEHHDALVAVGFGDVDEMYGRMKTTAPLRRVPSLGRLSDAVAAYFGGEVTAIDDVPVGQPGGPFRQAAWKVMREVPAGETITYTALAERAGSPAAVRAAGSACARNMVAIVVPCHRIVRTGGTLGGYYYGLPSKQWLLEHERRAQQQR